MAGSIMLSLQPVGLKHLLSQMTAQLHAEVIELTPEQWKAFCVDNLKDYLLREANKEDSGVSHSERLSSLFEPSYVPKRALTRHICRTSVQVPPRPHELTKPATIRSSLSSTYRGFPRRGKNHWKNPTGQCRRATRDRCASNLSRDIS